MAVKPHHMMKKILLLLALLAVPPIAFAVPAKRVVKKVRQSDGTSLLVMLRGDEYVHYYATTDGVPVLRSQTGDFTYAQFSGGHLEATGVVAHAAPQRAVSELPFVNEAPTVRKQMKQVRNQRLQPINRARAAVAEKRRQARRAPLLDASQERKTGLIILVNFKDKKLQETSTVEVFDRFANTEGLTNDVNYGSIHDYFHAQSYGKFNVTFDIVGPVTVSNNMSYYGENDKQGSDKHPEVMVYEALKLVDSQVDFKKYDWDGDGEVENIYVVYAGYGEASGADENTIWPHQWNLEGTYRSSQLRFDDVQLNTYACGAELMGDGYQYDEDGNPVQDKNGNYVEAESGELDGIGTMCHEFSHCLGLPDFYDTDYSYFGMDVWSVMDAGCNNEDGFSPTNYTAYERWYCGWMEPVELKEPAVVKDMPALADEPVAYIIYNDKDHNEYYLLENRQPIGFDRGHGTSYPSSYGSGLMISHVTYDQHAWYMNTVNNEKMQRMTLIPADGSLFGANDAYNEYAAYEEKYMNNPTTQNYNAYLKAFNAAWEKYYVGLEGDLWPCVSGKTAIRDLTDDSAPAAELNLANTDGKKLMHKPITDITQTATGRYADGMALHTISFKFMGGKLVAAPTNPVATGLSASGFTASWTPAAEAASYRLELREKKSTGAMEESLLLYEDFAALTTGEGDSNSDVADNLDNFTSTPGWTGSKIFRGGTGCKIGNRNGGYLQTPLLTAESGTLTVILTAQTFNNDAPNLTVEAISATDKTLATQTVEMNEEMQLLHLSVTEPCYIKLTPTKRAYIHGLMVCDGEFTLDDAKEYMQNDVKRLANTTYTTSETSYLFTDLSADALYAFRVQAIDAEGYESAWTEWVEVDLSSTNIDLLSITTTTPTRSAWYDMQGRRIAHPSAHGTYILRRGSTARKMIIQ